MTTYFITGGYGFLGQYIVKAIHEHDPDAELRVLVRTKRSTYLHIEELDRIQWVSGELTKPETFAEHLNGVDVIIHNAALVSFRRSDAEAVYQSNVIGTRNLAQAALDAGCKDFIFISSMSAVGVNPPQVSDESMEPDMEYKREHDMYGFSKRTSELELAALSDRMRVIMLNPSVILGPGSDRVLSMFKTAGLLPILPMLSYINSFVDVRDVARAVVLALTKGRSGERYIVTAYNVGMVEFAEASLRAMGKKPRIVPVSGAGLGLLDGLLWLMDVLHLNPGIRRPSEMVVDKACSWEKIRQEMGWEPAFTMEQAIQGSITGI